MNDLIPKLTLVRVNKGWWIAKTTNRKLAWFRRDPVTAIGDAQRDLGIHVRQTPPEAA